MACLAFVAFATDRRATQGPFAIIGATLVIALSAMCAGRVVRRGALTLLGAASACIAVWLAPQRPDVGSLLVLGAFFGIGAGLAAAWVPRFGRRVVPASAIVAIVGIVAVVVLRLAHDDTALLWVAAIPVVGSAVVTRVVHGRAPAGTSAARERTIAAALVLVVAGTTGYFGASTVSASWFGGGITHGARSSRMVALTFDDGPNAATTLPLMRLLDAHGVKATFFIVGKALDAYPEIVRLLVNDGHLVGDHSYQHDQWRWLDPRYPELDRTQQAFARHNLPCPAWFRPPHGQRTPFVARAVEEHHMRMVLWDAAAGDWATNDAALIARRVLAHARGGSIILLHDGLDGNPGADRRVILRAMPLILAGLKARGLEPVRLDTLLGGAAYTRC